MEIKKIPGCKNKWTVQSKPKYIKPLLSIILHHTGVFSDNSTISWFTKATQNGSNQDASAHYLIGINGDVWQFVDESERAWHAGVSELTINGIKYTNFNMFSLGIEITGNGNQAAYKEAQYQSLIPLLSMLSNRFNIKKEFILGHEQIAIPIGRKTDPGKLMDWRRVYEGVFDNPIPAGQNPANIIYSIGV